VVMGDVQLKRDAAGRRGGDAQLRARKPSSVRPLRNQRFRASLRCQATCGGTQL
jgi:hypothetical protein